MSHTYERHGRQNPWLRNLGYAISRPVIKIRANRHGFFEADHRFTHERIDSLKQKIERGETVHLVGLGAAAHNSGTALIEASKQGIKFLANNEEERYTQVKHCAAPPEQTLRVVERQLADRGLTFHDVHAFVSSWDYVNVLASSFSEVVAELPGSLRCLHPQAWPMSNAIHFGQGLHSSLWLTKQLGADKRIPVFGMRHHDNHAYFSYAASPFALEGVATLIAVIDGAGDDGSVSIYRAIGSNVELVYDNRSPFDSIAIVYMQLSSALGGWTALSSEGRFMGAAAWGNGDRMTNPYYFQRN